VGSTTFRLKPVSSVVTPEKTYVMNEPNVQGLAPIMTASTSSYLLNSTRSNEALFNVSTSGSRTEYRASEANWALMPKDMHATGSSPKL
jgi:hypothetical protein